MHKQGHVVFTLPSRGSSSQRSCELSDQPYPLRVYSRATSWRTRVSVLPWVGVGWLPFIARTFRARCFLFSKPTFGVGRHPSKKLGDCRAKSKLRSCEVAHIAHRIMSTRTSQNHAKVIPSHPNVSQDFTTLRARIAHSLGCCWDVIPRSSQLFFQCAHAIDILCLSKLPGAFLRRPNVRADCALVFLFQKGMVSSYHFHQTGAAFAACSLPARPRPDRASLTLKRLATGRLNASSQGFPALGIEIPIEAVTFF
jgi:hypothetical protein